MREIVKDLINSNIYPDKIDGIFYIMKAGENRNKYR
jgi:hypothetical protein